MVLKPHLITWSNLFKEQINSPFKEEVDEALQSAFCEFVFALPNGLDTLIGKDGTRLSGEHRHRISFSILLANITGKISASPTC